MQKFFFQKVAYVALARYFLLYSSVNVISIQTERLYLNFIRYEIKNIKVWV